MAKVDIKELRRKVEDYFANVSQEEFLADWEAINGDDDCPDVDYIQGSFTLTMTFPTEHLTWNGEMTNGLQWNPTLDAYLPTNFQKSDRDKGKYDYRLAA